MKEVTVDLLKKCANNLMFEMTDSQYEMLYEEFGVLIKQMALLEKIEGLEKVEPMTFPFECSTSFLREDEASTPLPREEALKNAKEVIASQIKLPKVVG